MPFSLAARFPTNKALLVLSMPPADASLSRSVTHRHTSPHVLTQRHASFCKQTASQPHNIHMHTNTHTHTHTHTQTTLSLNDVCTPAPSTRLALGCVWELGGSGLRFEVLGSGMRVQGVGFEISRPGMRVQGLRFEVSMSGHKVWVSISSSGIRAKSLGFEASGAGTFVWY
eukprot:921878-Rhodomonas_salina.1